jgi:oligopeptide/dipeptide ABC transporter ATP-binding protein
MVVNEMVMNEMIADAPLLEVRNLSKHFRVRAGLFGSAPPKKAVDDVSLSVDLGQTVAIVGESGSGKTTLARSIVGALTPTSGAISLRGEPLQLSDRRTALAQRRQVQMIFQDPSTSLNPRMKVGTAIAEGIQRHRLRSSRAATVARVFEILDMVGLPRSTAARLPHEMSGGQRQRVAIGRALSVEPSVILCDEAVSALDVSIQAQVLNLLLDLQESLGLSYLFITHDLGVVRHIADRVIVMYQGSVVEEAGNDELFDNPTHPYTELLLGSVPVPEPGRAPESGATPERPHAIPETGCRFAPRCAHAQPTCAEQMPQLSGSTSHQVACFVRSTAPQGEPSHGVGAARVEHVPATSSPTIPDPGRAAGGRGPSD